MRIQTCEEPASSVKADALIIGVTAGADGPRPAPGAREADDALGGTLTDLLTALGATGRPEEVTKIPTAGQRSRLAVPLIVAAGLGAGEEADGGRLTFSPETLRRAAGAATRAVMAQHASVRQGRQRPGTAGTQGDGGTLRIVLALPARDPAEAEAAALGALLGGYAYRRYRTSAPWPGAELALPTGDGSPAQQETGDAVRRAQVLADAVTLARDLVNTSPLDLPPAVFAEQAERVAAACGLEVEVLGEKELAEGGYGGILAVGQGSARPPRLVRLGYTHPGAAKTVVLAGKGITFDSGGLSLKPTKSMETMKSDMGGAAAVLAAMQAIAALKPAVNVVGYLPMAENMPGGGAQRPSDVITIYGGTTVEVLNTDAEGRLVLADALARSAGDSPDLVVDVATLTGSQTVALGRRIAGVMGSDDTVAAAAADAARRAGEEAWPMPLPGELRKDLDSSVADIANVPQGKSPGMLVAGAFLREFVPAGAAWAHFDIAGPAFNDGEPYGYTPRGGTGAAARALVQIAEDVAAGRLAAAAAGGHAGPEEAGTPG
jgi:leucyl aminopeptidase